MSKLSRITLSSISVYLLWVIFTYLLEGRLMTLLRPEAVLDRIVYITVANFLIGTVVALFLVRHILRSEFVTLEQTGFRSLRCTASTIFLGGLLGFIFYAIQNPPTLDPVVLSNAFAQVLTVTIAEAIICWAILGTVSESLTRDKGRYVSAFVAVIVASSLFGAYHFAHSPPFNTVDTVLQLTLVGAFIYLFHLIIRNIYATIVLHNFFGVLGVVQALESSGNLSSYYQPIIPLFAMAIIALVIFIGCDVLLIRRANYKDGNV